ncbi:MAG: IS21-like element helper ATPase IstB [Dehalococcoidia bacterium]|nr:IS21-like element helper ATPase IstB [Dehalococcoidia bacterium]
MLQNNTVAKLHEMKLSVMAKSFQAQMTDSAVAELSFEDRFSMLVDAEWTARKNNKLKRLIRKADFEYPGASLEDIEYREDRRLDKDLITRLASCTYVDERHNIILLGATGSGKTYLANAFGVKAARNFHTVRYIRLPELLTELALARAEGMYRKVIRQYRQVKLLILDEWLLYPLKETEARDLLEIAEGRYKKASTIFCSQFEVGGWHQKIGEPTLADAICDRIVHDSYTIVIGGKDSMRKVKGLKDEA